MSDLKWMRPLLAKLVGDDEPEAYDEDVAQAIRCLEEMRAYLTEIHRYDRAQEKFDPERHWYCGLYYHDLTKRNGVGYACTLPAATCLAIAAALGWEKP